jgi:hypothetical protein
VWRIGEIKLYLGALSRAFHLPLEHGFAHTEHGSGRAMLPLVWCPIRAHVQSALGKGPEIAAEGLGHVRGTPGGE